MGFNPSFVKEEYNMSKHLLDIVTLIFSCYLIFIEISYIYFKYSKKDVRFLNVSMWKYLECPIKTFKGEM